MKTTKKGFTLIELIVVIAIIGVLAALLVPAMLGYVKKSKIQSANSAAAEYCKAVSSAIADLEEEDCDVPDGKCDQDGYAADDGSSTPTTDDLLDYVQSYTDIPSNAEFVVRIKDGAGIYGAAKEGKYYGTSPKLLTQKNYDDKIGEDGDINTAAGLAQTKYNDKHSENPDSYDF